MAYSIVFNVPKEYYYKIWLHFLSLFLQIYYL